MDEAKSDFDTIIDLQPTVELKPIVIDGEEYLTGADYNAYLKGYADGKAEPKRGQTVRNADGEFVPFTCSCWHANPTEGDKHHNGRCTKYYDCIRTRENDPFPTMSGKTHKTYCIKRMDEVEE